MANDDLFARAERARRESAALARRFDALRQLRVLESDVRAAARQLAMAIESPLATEPDDGLRRLLTDAEWLLASSEDSLS